jgi:hypothetical protein
MQMKNNEAVWQEKGIKRSWGYRGTDVLPSVLSGQKGRRRQQVFLKHGYLCTKLHSVTFCKILILMSATVTTSELYIIMIF